jgi:hypothetical protein
MPTTPMTEWGFIGQETFVGIGKFATIYKFKQRCGFEEDSEVNTF